MDNVNNINYNNSIITNPSKTQSHISVPTNRFNKTIREWVPMYFGATCILAKNAIINIILDHIHSWGYHFVNNIRINTDSLAGNLRPEIIRQSFYDMLHNATQQDLIVKMGIATRQQLDQWINDYPQGELQHHEAYNSRWYCDKIRERLVAYLDANGNEKVRLIRKVLDAVNNHDFSGEYNSGLIRTVSRKRNYIRSALVKMKKMITFKRRRR